MSKEVTYVDFRRRKKLDRPTPLYVYPQTGKVAPPPSYSPPAPPTMEEIYEQQLNRISAALERINVIIAAIKAQGGLVKGPDNDVP